ncbi:MAG: cation transporter [Nitrospirae bacterium]|nr:cation transporter [Nitrospirota bacterium]
MADVTIKIGGMSCQHCVMRVKKAVEALAGVAGASVTVGQAQVSFDETKLTRSDIEEAIIRAGYKITG